MGGNEKMYHHIWHRPSMHWIDSALVLINALCISVGLLPNLSVDQRGILAWVIYGFMVFFSLELIVRFFSLGLAFFKDHRNIFSILVLGLAFGLKMPELSILLVFRFLRAARTLHFIPKTRHIIDTLFHTLPGVINLLILILICFSVFAVLGTKLFGPEVPDLWGTVTQSMITLQQIILADDWGNNLRTTTKAYPYAWVFFTGFLILMGFILLNLFIGIIIDAMQRAQEEEDKKK